MSDSTLPMHLFLLLHTEKRKEREKGLKSTFGLGARKGLQKDQRAAKSQSVTETVGVTYANMIKYNYMWMSPCFYQRVSC